MGAGQPRKVSAASLHVQVLSEIRCPRHCCLDVVHASAEMVHFSKKFMNHDFVFVFVFAVFVVLEKCVFCDVWFLCLHLVSSVFVVARVFVILDISLLFSDN